MDFRCDLHNHTMYSNVRLIDALSTPKALIDRAIELGLKGIAITDHEVLSAHPKANRYAEEIKEKNPDFKVILGNEIYLVDERPADKHYHYILLSKNKKGHRQLRELSSLAWLNNYQRNGTRVDTLKEDLERIIKKDPGNLIASTACIGGELGSCILELTAAEKINDTATIQRVYNKIIDFILWNKDLFKDDFYLEVQPGVSKEQITVNKRIALIAKAFNIKMICTSDSHYLSKEDRYVHKAFLNSHQEEREVDSFYQDAYLHSNEEMITKFTLSDFDESFVKNMFKNTMEIYDKIENYSLAHNQTIPKVDVPEYPKETRQEIINKIAKDYPTLAALMTSDDKIERYWYQECTQKLIELNKNTKEYWERLEEEAKTKKIISEKLGTNIFAYPITLKHYIDKFWECGSTVGAGRGSSCSGLNHYLLGVTQLDPIQWELPFWRYLNPERIELPDIDIDLAPSKKNMILKNIKIERGQNFYSDIDDIFKKNLGAVLVATFGTETTKSAIQTACRGYRSEDFPDGIDIDTAQYMSSLIPQERGYLWSLKDVVYGDKDKGRKPVNSFINEVNQYPGLLEIIMGIEGLVSRRGSHASGVIFNDEDPFEFNAYMVTPSGDITTQYDLHDAEWAGATKYDFLVTEVQDKIVQAINFLKEYGEIEKDLTLREAYDKYFHPNVLPLDSKEVWDNIDNVNILDLFQFDSDVGAQAAKKIKPRTILELSDANGLLRLMTSEDGGEQPMDKYIRFKNNISLWYEEMDKYGLTKEEQKVLEPHFLKSYGVPPSQEQLMTMLMDENICGFSLKDANTARKIVGKKQMSKIPELHQKILNQAKSKQLGKYVWECGVGPQMGYSFSTIHALAYSFIGFQTAYIATRWNPIYWDTACLVVNSGSLEENNSQEIVNIYEQEDFENYEYEDLPDRSGKIKKEKTSDYGKIAKAIGAITSKGIKVSLININTSDYGYKPDIENNRILYGLKALSNINGDTVEKIKANRPYFSLKDFMQKCPLTKTIMINLIKAGAFDEIDKDFNGNRKMIMAYYISQICEPKNRLTLQNFNGLIQHNLVPKKLELSVRIFNFNKYLKAYRKVGQYYTFDEVSIEFFNKFMEKYSEQIEIINGVTCILQTKWDKIYQSEMNIPREWLKANQEEILNKYNTELFKETWKKYAEGSLSHWEMQSLCFYHGDHELKNVDMNKYGLTDFFSLPSEPQVDYFFKRGNHQIPIYKLYRIIGTVLAKNDTKCSISLLTTTGVVSVKFTRDYYAMFKKQISQIQPDGSKKVMEKGWFGRGNMLMITGFRRDDQFVGKTYKNTGSHQLYKITEVNGNEIKLQHERFTTEKIDIED